jgi:hypothetical protein
LALSPPASPRALIGYGGAGFGLGVGTCALLMPHGLGLDEGLCFYQGRASTAVPVTVGLASVALGIAGAARSVRTTVVRVWLWCLAGLATVVTVPHSWSPTASTVHMASGCALFALALLLGATAIVVPTRVGLRRPAHPLAAWATLLTAIAAALGALYWAGTPQGYLTWAQIVFMAATLANYWAWLPDQASQAGDRGSLSTVPARRRSLAETMRHPAPRCPGRLVEPAFASDLSPGD